MGIANRVINILILVTAIVVVIFGCMLFNKREQLVQGWKTMSHAIVSTAKTIDDESRSGTNLSSELTAAKLDHKVYNADATNKLVAKLDAEAKRIIAQRSALADTLSEVASTLEVADETDSVELKKVAASSDRQAAIKERVLSVQTRNNGVLEQIVALSEQIEEPITVQDLKDNEQYRNSMGKVSRKVGSINDRKNALADHVKKVTDVLEIENPSLDGDDYADNLKRTVANVESYRDNFVKVKQDFEDEKKLTASLKSENEKKNAELKTQLAKIEKLNSEVTRLTKIINPDTNVAPEEVKTVAKEDVIKYIQGKVIYVDKKYGFLTLDIGSKNQIVQKIGKGFEQKIDAPLPDGEIMTVARDLASPEATFAGKVQIVKVSDYGAVANLLPLPKPVVYPQVGDTVYFSEEDLAMIAAKKKAEMDAKKAAADLILSTNEEAAPAAAEENAAPMEEEVVDEVMDDSSDSAGEEETVLDDILIEE